MSPPASSSACSSTRRAADSWKPAVPKICEPMWQWRPTNARPGKLADPRDGGRGILQCEAELLILVRGREEVVGLGVDTAVDAEQHALRGAPSLDDRGEALDLDQAVDDDRAHAGLDGLLELGDALVVAVEPEAGRVGARGEGHGELTAAAHIDREALFGDPAHDLGAEERLAGVVHARLHAVKGRRGAEGVESASRVRAHLVLVHHIQRCAESLAQRGRGYAAELQHAVVVASRRRPARRRAPGRSRRPAR